LAHEETNRHFHLHPNAKGLEVLLLAAIAHLFLVITTPNTEKDGTEALRIKSEAAGFRVVVVVEGDPPSATVIAAEKTTIGLESHAQAHLDPLSGIGGGPDHPVPTSTAIIILGIDHHLDTLCGRSARDLSLLAAQEATRRWARLGRFSPSWTTSPGHPLLLVRSRVSMQTMTVDPEGGQLIYEIHFPCTA
jgi:hypothetical protein